MDLAERLEALQARNEEPLPVANVPYTDDEAKAAFLALLAVGNPLPLAAQKAQRSLTWFKRRRNPEGRTYDAAFTAIYEEITAPGGDFESMIGLNAEAALIRVAEGGNPRAIEKLLAAYHPRYEYLKSGNGQGTWNVDQLQVFFGELPLSKLLELKEARQAERQKELPVIDL